MDIDEPFDTYKQRHRRRIAPTRLSSEEHHHEALSFDHQGKQAIRANMVVSDTSSISFQLISQNKTTSVKRSSQILTRRPNAKRMKSKSFDTDRITPNPPKRRLLRFSSLGKGRPHEASCPNHRREMEAFDSYAQNQRPPNEEMSQPPLHHGAVRHTVPVNLVPDKELIPISKLSLSSKDYDYLQSLAPLAFYREERYNWGHVKLTNLRTRSHFPCLQMTSQVPSFPQEPARRRADFKSISNKSAPKGRHQGLTRLRKHSAMIPKSARPRREGLILMRCQQPLRFFGDSHVERARLGTSDPLNARQFEVTSSLTRPSTIRQDQILATSSPSLVQITSPVSLADISTDIKRQVAKGIEKPNHRDDINDLPVSTPSSEDTSLAGHVNCQVKRSLQSTTQQIPEISPHKNAPQCHSEAVPSPLSNVTSHQILVSQSGVLKPLKSNHTQSYFGTLLHHLSDIPSVRQLFSDQRTSTSNVATRLTEPPERISTLIKSPRNAIVNPEDLQNIVNSEPIKSVSIASSHFLENLRPNDTIDHVFDSSELSPFAADNEGKNSDFFSGSEVSADNVVQIYDKDHESVAESETRSSHPSLILDCRPGLESSGLDSSPAQLSPKILEEHEDSLKQSYGSVSSSSEEQSKTFSTSILAPETPPPTAQCSSSSHLMTKPLDSNTPMYSSLEMRLNSMRPSQGTSRRLGKLSSHKSLPISTPSKSMSTISKSSIRPHPFLGKCQIQNKRLQHSPKFKICINGLNSFKRKGRLIGNVPSYFAGQHY
ncbi:hypothetical protein DFH28DRAFT_984357 [Melampsora americana]|nr:hypothetical protein DFH28DRAFT_984357 [Melampsora americana]